MPAGDDPGESGDPRDANRQSRADEGDGGDEDRGRVAPESAPAGTPPQGRFGCDRGEGGQGDGHSDEVKAGRPARRTPRVSLAPCASRAAPRGGGERHDGEHDGESESLLEKSAVVGPQQRVRQRREGQGAHRGPPRR